MSFAAKAGRVVAIATAVVTSASMATAQITDVTRIGNDLATVTAQRSDVSFSYDAAELTNVALLDIAGSDNDGKARIFTPQGGSVPPAGLRSSVIEDLSLATGFNNVEELTVGFTTPVVNSAGVDFLVVDWGSSDPIAITINGQTVNYAPGDYTGSTASGLNTSLHISDVPVNSKGVLEDAGTSFSPFSGSSATQGYIGVDLSDFGVALNSAATSVRIGDNAGSSSMDPLAVLGLPQVAGLVDDFEQNYGVGNDIHGVSGWNVSGGSTSQVTVADPQDASNRALQVHDANIDITHGTLLRDGGQGALQFRFYVPNDNGNGAGSNSPDVNFSLTHLLSPAAAVDGSTVVRVAGNNLMVHDDSDGSGSGGTFKTLSGISDDTWYTVRLEIDNAADVFSVLLKGGSYAEFTKLAAAGDDLFSFRNGVGANDLVNFYIRSNGGNGGDMVLVDDVLLSVPEPAGLALLGLGGVISLRRLRRG